MKKPSIAITLFAAAIVASAPLTTSALLGDVVRTAESAAGQIRDETKAARERGIPKEVQAKRQEIEARIHAKREAITEKLSGKRIEACQQKESKINQILDNRTEAAQRHYDTFKNIRDRLDAFVTDKGLEIDNAEALMTILNDSEASVIAAIETAKATDFSCQSTDAHAPGKIATDQVAAQKEALKTYRTDLKNYAHAIKTAATAPDSSDAAVNKEEANE